MNTRSMNKRNIIESKKLNESPELNESQDKQQLNESPELIEPPMIDFDEASRAWRQNKKCLPNGCFEYIRVKAMPTPKVKAMPPTPIEATPPRRNPPRNRRNLNNGA